MGDRATKTQRFQAIAMNEPDVRRFLIDVLGQSNMPLRSRNDICLAVDELFTNVSSYAYGASGGFVDITVSIDDGIRFASVAIADDGVEFDPFDYDRRRTTDLDCSSVGGLGISLVKRLMDECAYRHVRNRNEVTITKRWSVTASGNEALGEAARVIRETEESEYNAPERSQRPLTDDDLALVVGGLTMHDLPFSR